MKDLLFKILLIIDNLVLFLAIILFIANVNAFASNATIFSMVLVCIIAAFIFCLFQYFKSSSAPTEYNIRLKKFEAENNFNPTKHIFLYDKAFIIDMKSKRFIYTENHLINKFYLFDFSQILSYELKDDQEVLYKTDIVGGSKHKATGLFSNTIKGKTNLSEVSYKVVNHKYRVIITLNSVEKSLLDFRIFKQNIAESFIKTLEIMDYNKTAISTANNLFTNKDIASENNFEVKQEINNELGSLTFSQVEQIKKLSKKGFGAEPIASIMDIDISVVENILLEIKSI